MRWKWLVARRVFGTVPRSGQTRDFSGLASLGGDHSEPSRLALHLQACAIAVAGCHGYNMNGDIKRRMKYPGPLAVTSSRRIDTNSHVAN
jgi:hypothetical protein